MKFRFDKSKQYCVASMGRCGTTITINHLIDKLGVENVMGVHKREFSEFDGRVIFLFGNPINIALSSHAEYFTNQKKHYYNMGGDCEDMANYYERDTLHLEELFDDWYRPHPFPLMTIRYETMWEHLREIGDFLGVDMNGFPNYEKRKTDWEKLPVMARRKLMATYRRIYYKIESAKDIKIWEPL